MEKLSVWMPVGQTAVSCNLKAGRAVHWPAKARLGAGLDKKLSYSRETARQLPTWREGRARPSSPLPSAPSGYTYAYG